MRNRILLSVGQPPKNLSRYFPILGERTIGLQDGQYGFEWVAANFLDVSKVSHPYLCLFTSCGADPFPVLPSAQYVSAGNEPGNGDQISGQLRILEKLSPIRMRHCPQFN